ncbi:MAG: DNA mismatch endonuclease Vsr [Candidatus Marinimicrobia bacterium]|nr:DNA mismatch endonuclease Vsr [Candidatus Neomarinimicrobiota bacterium]MCF7827790.1 DNA mismatch endonuclease Vsr [Candidatus Neomarinimicrobiota bacterium]MCF7879455.1 DNA mismatch endonuclease Vsr [Candidatus Neomarinimicrobiota bacterium]
MTDVHEPEVRSYNMSRIRGKDTKPEMLVRKFLHSYGFRYRLHVNNLPGKPDLVLPKYNTAIFVHGCFWHAHEGCEYFKIPQTRTEFWKEKLFGNRERDEENISELRKMEWNVIVVWECELKSEEKEVKLQEIANKVEENK